MADKGLIKIFIVALKCCWGRSGVPQSKCWPEEWEPGEAVKVLGWSSISQVTMSASKGAKRCAYLEKHELQENEERTLRIWTISALLDVGLLFYNFPGSSDRPKQTQLIHLKVMLVELCLPKLATVKGPSSYFNDARPTMWLKEWDEWDAVVSDGW